MRILICHNDVETVAKWLVGFGRRGHDIRRARTVDEALRILRAQEVNVLIFDVMFGQENGLAVALMAEFHQPDIVSMLISDHSTSVQADFFGRLSSLRCMLGTQTQTEDLIAIAETLTERQPESCGDLSRDVPQICDTCQIRGSCLNRGETPVFRHREANRLNAPRQVRAMR